jgi:hypothetical protein
MFAMSSRDKTPHIEVSPLARERSVGYRGDPGAMPTDSQKSWYCIFRLRGTGTGRWKVGPLGEDWHRQPHVYDSIFLGKAHVSEQAHS